MGRIKLTNLRVVVIQPKPKHTSSTKVSKLLHGTVIEEDGVYKVCVDYDKDGSKSEILEFTDKSFDLVGRKDVFTREKDKYGNTVRIVRDTWKSKFFPGSREKYVPFAKNWIVKGYIVKEGLIKKFEFKDLVNIEGYNVTHFDDNENI